MAAPPNARTKSKNGNGLDVPALEGWLWEAACTIRGPLDAPKFKDYILPLIFLKRLSDVFDDELDHLARDFGDRATAAKLADARTTNLSASTSPKKPAGPRSPPPPTAWANSSPTPSAPSPARIPRLSGVVDVTDFNATAPASGCSTTTT